jgi:hypothetical protein
VIKERRMIWVGHVVHIAFKVSEGNPEGKRQLGKPRSRWEHNVKINRK